MIYSFRAECMHDVKLFLANSNAKTQINALKIIPDQRSSPDVKVEIESNASLAQLLALLDNQEDSHVIYETLRPVPLAENPLTRQK